MPQSAATHLTPVRTAGVQLTEAVRALRPDVGELAALVDELTTRVSGALAISHDEALLTVWARRMVRLD